MRLACHLSSMTLVVLPSDLLARRLQSGVVKPGAAGIPAVRWLVLAILAVVVSSSAARSEDDSPTATAREHWSFQRLKKPIPPDVTLPGASLDPIDRFIAARWEESAIEPIGLADRRTLVRRLYFDLHGLPPTPSEVETFVAEDSEQDVGALVDGLLERLEFGERWGRYWLDVARYADSNGCSQEANSTYNNAWRYRDYVIAALNEDLPFDRFVIEQIAGDLLPAVSDQQRCRQLIATGFLSLGPKVFGTDSYELFRLDVWDEQIDTIGKAFLGLAVGCARCHDHKFDPVSTQDYYALTGIFASTKSVRRADWQEGKTWNLVPLPMLDAETSAALEAAHKKRIEDAKEGPVVKAAQEALDEAKKQLEQLRKEEATSEKIEAANKIMQIFRREVREAGRLAKVLPHMSPVPAAMAVEEMDKMVDQAIRLGGVHDNHGDVVPRAVPPLFGAEDAERYAIPEGVSGRLQLARWMVDPDQGAGHLLARVTVNRIWNHLLGRPLVASVENFGLTGDRPSHPELLEYLAATFIEDGWSVKRLVRRITLARVYQLAAARNLAAEATDPGNVLLWRHHPRRLDAEALRDSLLAISGQLDRTRGGKTLQHQGLLAGPFMELETPSPYLRRTVYVPIFRSSLGVSPESDELMDMLTTFDFPDTNFLCAGRNTTTVPSQSLFLMNSPFIYDRAKATAQGLLADDRLATDEERLDALFLWVLCRPATPEEIQQSLVYLEEFPVQKIDTESVSSPAAQLDGWTSLCQALFGSSEFLFLN